MSKRFVLSMVAALFGSVLVCGIASALVLGQSNWFNLQIDSPLYVTRNGGGAFQWCSTVVISNKTTYQRAYSGLKIMILDPMSGTVIDGPVSQATLGGNLGPAGTSNSSVTVSNVCSDSVTGASPGRIFTAIVTIQSTESNPGGGANGVCRGSAGFGFTVR